MHFYKGYGRGGGKNGILRKADCAGERSPWEQNPDLGDPPAGSKRVLVTFITDARRGVRGGGLRRLQQLKTNCLGRRGGQPRGLYKKREREINWQGKKRWMDLVDESPTWATGP